MGRRNTARIDHNVQACLKILQIHSSPSPGGGTVHVTDLANGLAQRGHRVHVACRANGHVPRLLGDADVRTHTLPLRGGLDLNSIARLAALIRREQFDILHAHSGRDYALCRMAHNLAPGGNMIFSRHLLKVNKPRWLARQYYRSAARTITISEAVRSVLIRELDLPSKMFITIPNWLDLQRFEELPSPEEARRKFSIETRHAVGVVGSVIPIKGQEEFVRAAAQVLQQHSDTTFLVVGNNPHGDKAYFSKLQALRRDLGLGERLRFVDWVNDISTLLPALTVSVVPSWCDAFSLVLIESMAAGVPVVAAAAGGPAEIVEDEVNGLAVEPCEVEPLAEAMNRLLCDEALRVRLSAEARTTVKQRFERQSVISRIEALYREIVGHVALSRSASAEPGVVSDAPTIRR